MNRATIEDRCLIHDYVGYSFRSDSFTVNIYKIVWVKKYPLHIFSKGDSVTHTCNNKNCINIEHISFSKHIMHSKERTLERLKKNAISKGDCLITHYATSSSGYGRITVKSKLYNLHRVVWWIHSDIEQIEDLPKKKDGNYIVRHQCPNKLCLNGDHYKIGTHKDNMEDMIKSNTRMFGENHCGSTITLHTAQSIADSWLPDKTHKDYLTLKQRAAKFGVSMSLVNHIDERASWPQVVHPNKKEYSTPIRNKTKLNDSNITTEDWKEIMKRIVDRVTINEYDNVFCESPCWEISLDSKHVVKCSYKNRKKAVYIWACEYAAKRFIIDGESTRHLCNNGPKCCNPSHLKFGSAYDQSADKRKHGTYGHKLTENEVAEIILDSRATKTIATAYGVSVDTISSIKRGKTWK